MKFRLKKEKEGSEDVSSGLKLYNRCSKGAEYGAYNRKSINSDSQVNVGALLRPIFRPGMSPTHFALTIAAAVKFDGLTEEGLNEIARNIKSSWKKSPVRRHYESPIQFIIDILKRSKDQVERDALSWLLTSLAILEEETK